MRQVSVRDVSMTGVYDPSIVKTEASHPLPVRVIRGFLEKTLPSVSSSVMSRSMLVGSLPWCFSLRSAGGEERRLAAAGTTTWMLVGPPIIGMNSKELRGGVGSVDQAQYSKYSSVQ